MRSQCTCTASVFHQLPAPSCIHVAQGLIRANTSCALDLVPHACGLEQADDTLARSTKHACRHAAS